MPDSNARPPASVLIVGAGPTGLTLAAALARYGAGVRLIERRTRLSRHTKATNLMQRSQEALSALGLLDPVAAVGGRMTRLMVHAYGRCFGPSTMHLRESPFHDVVLCGQERFEAAVAAALPARGVAIEFGTELVGLTQTPAAATATLAVDGRTESAAFDYVVGCDGGSGATRTFTKNDFTPTKTDIGIRQVDCRLAWRRPSSMDQMWLFYFQNGFAAVVPLPGGVHRVLTIEPKANVPERPPTLAEMQDALRRIAADDGVSLSGESWTSYTDLSMGIGPGLRDGRVLLAGDSGNPILPNGGQGMNTGIGDAFNLAWKLAAVIGGTGPDALLDTYDHERHALRRSLQNAQYQSLKYTTHVTPRWMQLLLKAVGPTALRWGGEYRMAQAFSQLRIDTRRSPLTLERLGRRGGVRAGDRALNETVVAGGRTLDLYDVVYVGGWTLLAFTGTGRRCRAADVAAALAAVNRPDLSPHVVSTAAAVPAGCPALYDLDEAAHRAYGVTRPTLYLVRPDGHVAARVGLDGAARLAEHARRWAPLVIRHASSVTAASPAERACSNDVWPTPLVPTLSPT